jgi:hypothetical protein
VAKWTSVAGGLFWIALGLAMVWAAWATWGEFAQLESGQLRSMKIWAPLAWIYNLGGLWSVIAKWATIAFLALVGMAFVAAGITSLRPDEEQPAEDASHNR